MSSDLYYQTEDLPKAAPTVKEELEALKAQMARLVTALQDATDRTNRLERQVEAQKEILTAIEPVFAVTTEERQRIELLERSAIDAELLRANPNRRPWEGPPRPWITPAFVTKAHVLGIFNKK